MRSKGTGWQYELAAGVVGLADLTLSANYVFFRHAAREWTLPRRMGPYPWYLVTGIAIVPLFFSLLYSPFWWSRRRSNYTDNGAQLRPNS